MTTKTKKKKAKVTQRKASEVAVMNIRFVGKTKLRSGKTVEMTDAPKEFNSGGATTVKLPSVEEQKAGFYLEPKVASQLIREHPTMYKKPTRLSGAAAAANAKQTESGENKDGSSGAK